MVNSLSPIGPLMLDIAGQQLTDRDRELLRSPMVGGVILFARNIGSREQVCELNAAIRAVNPNLLIAVDQEGGRVARLRSGYTALPPMQALGQWWQRAPDAAVDGAHELGWLMASEVLASGFDFSFAPVLDVDSDFCSVIGDRAFADSAAGVVALAAGFIAGMAAAGMAATGKHFPGHGGVRGDSHLELPVDSRSWSELAESDLQPFAALAAELGGMMPAHILFPAVDEQWPVGFSRHWLQDKLRAELGFGGVIFSDDLSMEGAAAIGSYPQRAQAALAAGCDMVLVCNHREGAEQVAAWLAQQPLPDTARLPAMRRRQNPDWQSLMASPRWASAVAVSESLLNK